MCWMMIVLQSRGTEKSSPVFILQYLTYLSIYLHLQATVSICLMDQTDHEALDTAAIPIHRPHGQAKQQMAGQDAAQA